MAEPVLEAPRIIVFTAWHLHCPHTGQQEVIEKDTKGYEGLGTFAFAQLHHCFAATPFASSSKVRGTPLRVAKRHKTPSLTHNGHFCSSFLQPF